MGAPLEVEPVEAGQADDRFVGKVCRLDLEGGGVAVQDAPATLRNSSYGAQKLSRAAAAAPRPLSARCLSGSDTNYPCARD
jgi:hypothetical protein